MNLRHNGQLTKICFFANLVRGSALSTGFSRVAASRLDSETESGFYCMVLRSVVMAEIDGQRQNPQSPLKTTLDNGSDTERGNSSRYRAWKQ